MKQKNKAFIRKLFFFVISICVLPLLVSLILNIKFLYTGFNRIPTELGIILVGFGFFLILYVVFGPPLRSYILEHELSHIIFAWLTGTRVKSVSFNIRRSYVKTDRINAVIALAPYAFPLYTFVLVFAYKLALLIVVSRIVTLGFFFMVGVTLSLHMISTMHYIRYDQPDLARYGYFSSLIMVTIWTIIVLAVLFSLLFPAAELLSYLKHAVYTAFKIYRSCLLLLKVIM